MKRFANIHEASKFMSDSDFVEIPDSNSDLKGLLWETEGLLGIVTLCDDGFYHVKFHDPITSFWMIPT